MFSVTISVHSFIRAILKAISRFSLYCFRFLSLVIRVWIRGFGLLFEGLPIEARDPSLLGCNCTSISEGHRSKCSFPQFTHPIF